MAELMRFWDRPKPRRGPHVPYENSTDSNPVLRGIPLVVLGVLVRSSSQVQNILWRLNNFQKLQKIPNLDDYEPRYSPAVIPILPEPKESLSIARLPAPLPRKEASHYYTCADYHELYKSGTITPLQVAEYLVSVVSRPNKSQAPDRFSVAFIDTIPELVLEAARASTERYEKGEYLSVLDGVPVAVKDEIELREYSKTQGTSLDFSGSHNQTGWCVRKWQEAGAVVIGKTNMHEMGLDTSGFNSYWGTPLNPHNEGYYTGGSSSGSACTVAQGVCPVTLGADGGGSIRIPASFCGLYGLKPSHGRVSGGPTKDLAKSVGVYGPIASSLDDLALAYRIMAQPDLKSEVSSLFLGSLSEAAIPPTSKKVLGLDRAWIARSDPVVLQMFEKAVDHYVNVMGYETIDINLPYLPDGQKAHALTSLSEVRSGVTWAQILKLSFQNQALLSTAGGQVSAQDFLCAQRVRNIQMQNLAWLWDKYPGMLILTPTTPCAGWKIKHPSDVVFRGNGASDSDMSLRSMEYIYVANWTGAPALTMPMGYTEDDVPVGLMATAEWGNEEQLLLWASEGDGILSGGVRRPRPAENWIDVIDRVKNTKI